MKSFHKKIQFDGVEVYKILIDDYPKGRDPAVFEEIAEKYDIDHLVLNPENLGLSQAWAKAWTLVPSETDYIWHQEDDFVFNNEKPFQMQKLIKIFESCPTPLTQLVLKRQQWYQEDNDFTCKIMSKKVGREVQFDAPTGDGDVMEPQCVVIHQYYFNANPCFYPRWVIEEKYPHCPQESVVVNHLRKLYPDRYSGILGHATDPPLVDHIGEYNQGKKVLDGEPGWTWMNKYDPDKKYYSRHYLKEWDKK